jgi:1-acyl-sn-glycerol-3-phosphate acyltransferase
MELLARLEDRLRLVLPEREAIAARTARELSHCLARANPRVVPSGDAGLTEPESALDPPHSATTLTEVLDWHAARRGESLHVRFEFGDCNGRTLSFGMLAQRARRCAAGLRRRGLGAQETVALMFPTHEDLLVAFFATLYAGAVPVPLYPPQRARDLGDYWRRQAGIVRDAGARLMLIGSALATHRHGIAALGGASRLATLAELESDQSEPVTAPLDGGSLALLQYTSGSTGDPKGVMLTHANLLANLRAMGTAAGIRSGDAFASWLPLYHDMGLIGAWLGSLYFALPLLLMPPQSFLLRPERWLWSVHRHRATISAAPNFAYELCVHRIQDAAIEGLDLSRWRLAFCGAEPVFPETIERFCTCFSRFGFRREAMFPVYGRAEAALGVSFPPLERGPRIVAVERDALLSRGRAVLRAGSGSGVLRFVSCGRALPGHEVRVVDVSGRECPPAHEGRIQFEGPSATIGYFGNPRASAQLKCDGWVETGDLGLMLAGEIFITGRSKDLIIRAGRHVHPQAVEQAIGAEPGVRRGRVVVFGSTDPIAGTEKLIVVAETRERSAEQLAELKRRVEAGVASLIGEPTDDVVLTGPGAILKTSSGKLRRSACRTAYKSGNLGSAEGLLLARLYASGLLRRLRAALGRTAALAFAAWAWSVFTLLGAPASLLFIGLPTRALRWHALRSLAWLLAILCGVRPSVSRATALPALPCIFVANHQSYLDALALLLVIPRPIRFVAKAEFATRRFGRWLFERAGALFVDRFDPEHCTDVVRMAAARQVDVLIFPEGTFACGAGLLPFKLGAFVAAIESSHPVVPIAIRGTRSILRGEERFPHHVAVAVVVGAALAPESTGDPWHGALELSTRARQFILAHVDEPDLGR